MNIEKKRKKRKFSIIPCFPMLKAKELQATVIAFQEKSHFTCTSTCGNGMFKPSTAKAL